MFDALVGFNFEEGGIGPGVAERWDLADDGLAWTFYLRKGLKWHNGDPLTAHDVKFSLERTMSKESIASRASALRRNVKGINVIDDHTVQIFTNGVHVCAVRMNGSSSTMNGANVRTGECVSH